MSSASNRKRNSDQSGDTNGLECPYPLSFSRDAVPPSPCSTKRFRNHHDDDDADLAIITDESEAATVKTEVLHKGEENEINDEFDDDFEDFTADDFARMDEVVAASTSKTRLSAIQRDTTDLPNSKSDAFGNHANNDDDDEFGNLPEIDGINVDEVVAAAEVNSVYSEETGVRVFPAPQIFDYQTSKFSLEEPVRFPSYTRYKILDVLEDHTTYTKAIVVANWTEEMMGSFDDQRRIHNNIKAVHVREVSTNKGESNNTNTHRQKQQPKPIGVIYLRDHWFCTPASKGDAVHLCSLYGKHCTNAEYLPVLLDNSTTDLVLVLHPDELITPTTVSDTISCTRLAVIKSRLGSTGLSSRAALFGTMRHALVGTCLHHGAYDDATMVRYIQKIVAEQAESLIGCHITAREAQKELARVLPQIRDFANSYTSFGPAPWQRRAEATTVQPAYPGQLPVQFVAQSLECVEEPITSLELGLKGVIDSIFAATTTTTPTRVSSAKKTCFELKTGHNQSIQLAHMAQLSLYIIMLQGRHGFVDNTPIANSIDHMVAAPNGMMLYLNNEGINAYNLSPTDHEVMNLISQRNTTANGLVRAARPRGIQLFYETEDETGEERACVKIFSPPPADLPDLSHETQACARCYANRECMVYRSVELDYQRGSTGMTLDDHPAHKDLLKKYTGHLKPSHIQYFRDWDRMIDLEADALTSKLANGWLVDAERREAESGDCISSLVFDGVAALQGDGGRSSSQVLLRFRRSGRSKLTTPLSNLGFLKGVMVAISTERPILGRNDGHRRHQHYTIRGIMESTTLHTLVVRTPKDDLERIQRINSSTKLFRIDKDGSSVGVGTLRQNLVNLLSGDYIQEQNVSVFRHRLSRLRGAIIDLEPPTFEETSAIFSSDIGTSGCDVKQLQVEYDGLNPDQQRAIQKAVDAKDYALIQGLPGTGKSHTISFLARLFVAKGKRVLITSYTHAAVDNVLLKLREKGMDAPDRRTGVPPLVRVGQTSSCHKDVNPLLASSLALGLDERASRTNNDRLDYPSIESLEKVMSNARVVCVSALSVPRSALVKIGTFDVVIVDEAGQISQPAILGALMAADSFLLVGDHMQLPPLVTSDVAEQAGYGVSMMKRLADAHPQSVAQLTLQYRMNSSICRLSSNAVYEGKLHCANDTVASRILHLPGLSESGNKSWLFQILDPNKPVVFVDTDAIRTGKALKTNKDGEPALFEKLETKLGGRRNGNVVNYTEATIVRILAIGLIRSGLAASDLGIISPFRSQLRILEDDNQLSTAKLDGLELSTIDRYQGRDKQAIIFSLVRSNAQGHVGRLLNDLRRLNVSLTRAKRKMVLVGSFRTLSSSTRGDDDALRDILNGMAERQECFQLPADAIVERSI